MFFFFFQAEDGIRDSSTSRGLGDVYKRQITCHCTRLTKAIDNGFSQPRTMARNFQKQYGMSPQKFRQAFATTKMLPMHSGCLLYTSDAADDTPCVDLGGRRIIKKKKHITEEPYITYQV
ncbi:putative transcriptional regulator [Lactobacillus rhamnosus GG] [Lacticaseibacillus rhamnosus]|nr:putative transcriptional regulator [Lactobacillus rhamnosus GG] [Lacticaseibacillus rhamnosus]